MQSTRISERGLKTPANDSVVMMARALQDALAAWELVRKVAQMWGIPKERFVDDWLSHVYGEKSGLEREAAFHD